MSHVLEQQADRRFASVTGGAVILAGIITLLLSSGTGIRYSNPPQFDATWPVIWTLTAAVLIGGAIAARKGTRKDRALASLGCAIALLATWFPFTSYFGNYHGYPLGYVAPLGLLSTAVAYFSGMRIFAVASAVFLCILFGPPLLPPDVIKTKSLKKGDLTCTYLPSNAGVEVRLSVPEGRSLAKELNVERVEIVAAVNPFNAIEVSAHQLRWKKTSSSALFTTSLKVEPWIRSKELAVRVIRWPKPILFIDVSLKDLKVDESEKRSGGYSLAVSDIHRSETRSSLPSQKRIAARITYRGFPRGGGNYGDEFRVVDNVGNVVRVFSNSVQGTHDGTTEYIEIIDVDSKATSLRFELFSQQALEDSVVEFDFGRI